MTPQQKKTSLIIGIVLLVLIAGGLVWYSASRPAPASLAPGASSAAFQQNVKSIIQSGDPSQCASVNVVADGVNYETVCKNNIAWNTAQANLDVAACNALDNKLMSIADCQSSVIAGLIVKRRISRFAASSPEG